MKLYYSPGACSLSPHIVAEEAGIVLQLDKVDLAKKLTESGADFTKINPKGYVPALELDDGTVLSEGVSIVMYLCNFKPTANLMPQAGSLDFLKFFEQMLYITTELHKGFGALFTPIDDGAKDVLKKKLRTRLAFTADQLQGRDYLFGEHFTAADAYLYTVLRWSPMLNVDLGEWPVFADYMARMEARPGVQAALAAEGQQPQQVSKAA